MNNSETSNSLTANEIELLEVIRTAENPEEVVIFMFDLLKQILDENSTTSKIIKLILGRYSSIAEFAKAIKMSEKATVNIITGKTEPTLDEVIIIAKAFNKEPEEIAEFFITKYSK